MVLGDSLLLEPGFGVGDTGARVGGGSASPSPGGGGGGPHPPVDVQSPQRFFLLRYTKSTGETGESATTARSAQSLPPHLARRTGGEVVDLAGAEYASSGAPLQRQGSGEAAGVAAAANQSTQAAKYLLERMRKRTEAEGVGPLPRPAETPLADLTPRPSRAGASASPTSSSTTAAVMAMSEADALARFGARVLMWNGEAELPRLLQDGVFADLLARSLRIQLLVHTVGGAGGRGDATLRDVAAAGPPCRIGAAAWPARRVAAEELSAEAVLGGECWIALEGLWEDAVPQRDPAATPAGPARTHWVTCRSARLWRRGQPCVVSRSRQARPSPHPPSPPPAAHPLRARAASGTSCAAFASLSRRCAPPSRCSPACSPSTASRRAAAL